jgi:four helix bundle protein
MEQTNFERLRIYQLAEALANEIWSIVYRWERFARDTVGRQIVRAADSIGANIAEGVGRGSLLDNRRFRWTARASLNETKHRLRLAYHRKLLDEGAVRKVKPLVDELGPKLNAYLRSLTKRSLEERSVSKRDPATNN